MDSRLLNTKIIPSNAENLLFRLSWASKQPMECDLMAFMLDENDSIPTRWDIIFYNVHRHESRSIEQLGLKLNSCGGKDEIKVIPNKIPDNFKKILFLSCVYEGHEQNQDLTDAHNLIFEIINIETNDTLFQYTISSPKIGDESVILGALIRENNSWTYEVLDTKCSEQLIGVIATHYGMRVDWRSDYKNITGVN